MRYNYCSFGVPIRTSIQSRALSIAPLNEICKRRCRELDRISPIAHLNREIRAAPLFKYSRKPFQFSDDFIREIDAIAGNDYFHQLVYIDTVEEETIISIISVGRFIEIQSEADIQFATDLASNISHTYCADKNHSFTTRNVMFVVGHNEWLAQNWNKIMHTLNGNTGGKKREHKRLVNQQAGKEAAKEKGEKDAEKEKQRDAKGKEPKPFGRSKKTFALHELNIHRETMRLADLFRLKKNWPPRVPFAESRFTYQAIRIFYNILAENQDNTQEVERQFIGSLENEGLHIVVRRGEFELNGKTHRRLSDAIRDADSIIENNDIEDQESLIAVQKHLRKQPEPVAGPSTAAPSRKTVPKAEEQHTQQEVEEEEEEEEENPQQSGHTDQGQVPRQHTDQVVIPTPPDPINWTHFLVMEDIRTKKHLANWHSSSVYIRNAINVPSLSRIFQSWRVQTRLAQNRFNQGQENTALAMYYMRTALQKLRNPAGIADVAKAFKDLLGVAAHSTQSALDVLVAFLHFYNIPKMLAQEVVLVCKGISKFTYLRFRKPPIKPVEEPDDRLYHSAFHRLVFNSVRVALPYFRVPMLLVPVEIAVQSINLVARVTKPMRGIMLYHLDRIFSPKPLQNGLTFRDRLTNFAFKTKNAYKNMSISTEDLPGILSTVSCSNDLAQDRGRMMRLQLQSIYNQGDLAKAVMHTQELAKQHAHFTNLKLQLDAQLNQVDTWRGITTTLENFNVGYEYGVDTLKRYVRTTTRSDEWVASPVTHFWRGYYAVRDTFSSSTPETRYNALWNDAMNNISMTNRDKILSLCGLPERLGKIYTYSVIGVVGFAFLVLLWSQWRKRHKPKVVPACGLEIHGVTNFLAKVRWIHYPINWFAYSIMSNCTNDTYRAAILSGKYNVMTPPNGRLDRAVTILVAVAARNLRVDLSDVSRDAAITRAIGTYITISTQPNDFAQRSLGTNATLDADRFRRLPRAAALPDPRGFQNVPGLVTSRSLAYYKEVSDMMAYMDLLQPPIPKPPQLLNTQPSARFAQGMRRAILLLGAVFGAVVLRTAHVI